MTTTDGLRRLAAGFACAVAVGVSGCGGATQSSACTVDEEALAERIADRVYERLRSEGYAEPGAGASAGGASRGRSRAAASEPAEGGAITPRNIVNALRRGLQGAPSDGDEEP